MTLTLTIENETSLPNGAPVSVKITDKRNLDIGRGAHLDWTLPDPTRFISGKHCEVRYRDDAYWLYDVSTNGTFLNDNTRRLQTPHKLRDGDRLAIGSYIIAVRIEDEPAKAGAIAELAGSTAAESPYARQEMAEAHAAEDYAAEDRYADRMGESQSFGAADTDEQPEFADAPEEAIASDALHDEDAIEASASEAHHAEEHHAEEQPFEAASFLNERDEAAEEVLTGEAAHDAEAEHRHEDAEAASDSAETGFPSPGEQPHAEHDAAEAHVIAPAEEEPSVPVSLSDPFKFVAPFGGMPRVSATPDYFNRPAATEDHSMDAEPAAKPVTTPPFTPPPLTPPPFTSPAFTPPPLARAEAASAPAAVAPAPVAAPVAAPAQTPAPRAETTPPAPRLPKAEPPAVPPASTAEPKSDVTLEDFVQQFATAAGVPLSIFERQDKLKLADDLGYLMHFIAESMTQLLSARFRAKRFARTANQTMVQAFDNNPLKFAPTPEDALKIMFGPKTSGYLDARRALEGAFGDLKTHQIKTFSAMQSALKMLVEDLDPEEIDTAMGEDKGLSALFTSRKARLWDFYMARWQAKTLRHEDGLVDAFMLYFADAYDRDD